MSKEAADLEAQSALCTLASASSVPVCLCDEGDTVYFGQTAFEVLWTYDDGEKLLRHCRDRDLVRFAPGIEVSLRRPMQKSKPPEGVFP